MNVLLLQLDGKLPNLALMRIAAFHRDAGDTVTFRHAPKIKSVERGMWDAWDRVYASLIFERSRPVAERLRAIYPDAIIGGTGWDIGRTLADVGIPPGRLDYTDYPNFRSSIGFTQRGCRLKCSFCVVPRKEGSIRQEATIQDIWRGNPWPRELVLLDNDFFGQPHWRERIAEIREGRFKVNFCQGVNARLISEEAAVAIASVDYRAGDMKHRQIYTAWDNRGDEEVLFRGLRRLVEAGIRPSYIMVYMLIGYWPGETEEDWLYRRDKLREFGAIPYPMPFVRNHLTVGFQRWCIGGQDKYVSWETWKKAQCEPRKLTITRKMELPLFDQLEEEVA